MRTRTLALLLWPLLLLATACADQLVAPQDAAFNKGQGKPGGGGSDDGGGGGDGGLTSSFAVAINDHGVVVGNVNNATGDSRMAVRWLVDPDGNVSGPHELGTLGGAPISEATGVNNADVIVGYAEHDHWTRRAFIYYNGNLRALTLPDSAVSSWALKINEAGVAVGDAAFIVEGQRIGRTLVWLDPLDSTAQPIQLPPLEGHASSSGRWINNHGVVGGWSGEVQVRWQRNLDGSFSGPEPIGDLYVYAMNDAPEFVGTSNDAQNQQGALLRSAALIPLGPLSQHTTGWARGLNNPATGQPLQIVGVSGFQSGTDRPVLWKVDSSGAVTPPIDLGLPGTYSMAAAGAVNAHGWIAGHGYNSFYDRMATLWRPQGGDSGYEIIVLGALGAGGEGGEGGEGSGDREGSGGGEEDEKCAPKGHRKYCK